jgi:hypothetical protein
LFGGYLGRVQRVRCCGPYLSSSGRQCQRQFLGTPMDGRIRVLELDQLQLGRMAFQAPLQGLAQILEQMEAIGHLHGCGSTPLCPIGVDACPIAANDSTPG